MWYYHPPAHGLHLCGCMLHIGQHIHFNGLSQRNTGKELPNLFFFLYIYCAALKMLCVCHCFEVQLSINDIPACMLKSGVFVCVSGMRAILHTFNDTL